METTTFRLGITGGIGSGKSSVAGLLRVMGIPVYDCDAEARRLMTESAPLRTALVALAGPQVYTETPSVTLNRRYLADFMFGHPDRVDAVNAIVHPAVREDFRLWTAHHKALPLVAMESAILFEAGMRGDVDAVVLVYTPLAERIRRTMGRDGASESSVRARLASQQSDDDKLTLADYVIHNAEADAVTPQVTALLTKLPRHL